MTLDPHSATLGVADSPATLMPKWQPLPSATLRLGDPPQNETRLGDSLLRMPAQIAVAGSGGESVYTVNCDKDNLESPGQAPVAGNGWQVGSGGLRIADRHPDSLGMR